MVNRQKVEPVTPLRISVVYISKSAHWGKLLEYGIIWNNMDLESGPVTTQSVLGRPLRREMKPKVISSILNLVGYRQLVRPTGTLNIKIVIIVLEILKVITRYVDPISKAGINPDRKEETYDSNSDHGENQTKWE